MSLELPPDNPFDPDPDSVTPVAVDEEEDFQRLNRECWRLLRDMVYNGRVVLKSGLVSALKPEALFDLIMRLAQMKPPKTERAPDVIDFAPGVTYRGKEADPPTDS